MPSCSGRCCLARRAEIHRVAAAALLCAPLASAQATRLNDPLPHLAQQAITEVASSPDGNWLVYGGDPTVDGALEFFSVRSDHSAGPFQLTPPGSTTRLFFDRAVSNERFVYLSTETPSGSAIEVWSVPLDGSAGPTLLSTPGDFPERLWLSPDGAHALVRRTLIDLPFIVSELDRIPIAGGAPVPLAQSDRVGPPSFLVDLSFTGDGQRILFRSSNSDGEGDEDSSTLYVVPLDGSQPQLALSVPGITTRVLRYVLSQDDSRVAYTEAIGFTTYRTYSGALDGSARTLLATGSGDVPLTIAADGSRVAYLRTHLFSVRSDGTGTVQLDLGASVNAFQQAPDGHTLVYRQLSTLYRVPIDGSSVAELLFGPGVSTEVAFSADSNWVLAPVLGGFGALYGVPLAGGAARLLNGPASAGEGLVTDDPVLAVAGNVVVYRQERGGPNRVDLYAAPLDGSASETRLSDLPGTQRVSSFLALPGAARVAYLADPEDEGTVQLYGARLDGVGKPTLCHAPLATGPVAGDVLAFATGEGEAPVVFRGDQARAGLLELFAAARDGRGPARRISQAIDPGEEVQPLFAVGPSGRRVVYLEQASGLRLFVTTSDGSEPARPLSGASREVPAPLVIAPDESRVVFRRSLGSTNPYGLFSANLEGTPGPKRLNPGAIAQATVSADFALTPDGTRAVYRCNQEEESTLELYSVPSDGSGPPVRLNPPLAAARRVEQFRIAPDGRRVFYRANARLDSAHELFAAPVLGGPSVCLHPRLAPGRDVTDFAITPDGTRVVYRADETVDGQFELYAAPSSGFHPPLGALAGRRGTGRARLTPLATGQDVQGDFVLSPTTGSVCFRITSAGGPTELYRVPLDGSGPPQRLNGALPTGGNVVDFLLTPDGSALVYRADERVNERFELFRVSAGGGPAVLLAPMPPSGDVYSYRLGPDSAWVVYLADGEHDDVPELFAAPLDGSAAPRRISNPLAPGGAVQPDYRALAGGRAIFRADQREADVLELYLGPVQAGPLRAPPP